MGQIDYSKIKKVHFIGIGGTSMSGLAHIASTKNLQITGSDMRACPYTDKLIEEGFDVTIGHATTNIPLDCDLVVYTAAINKNNAELKEALRRHIPIVQRSEFLGYLTSLYPKTLAAAGTHGKTTTSSMLSLLLLDAGLDPSVSIGGTLKELGGNYRIGNSDYFVTEACEYVDSFLKSHHDIAIISNVEPDHLDYFTGGIDQIRHSFLEFAKILPADGLLVLNGDDKELSFIAQHCRAPVYTFGLGDDNDYYATNIIYSPLGIPEFDVIKSGNFLGHFQLQIPGEHNVLNALSTIVCGDFLKIPVESIQKTLQRFGGTKRRFEFRGEVNGIKVYEDYAHHPTEVKVTIEACHNYEQKRLWVVFQPHTYSRTYDFFDEFSEALSNCDFLIMNDIYSDREVNLWDISSEMVAEEVQKTYGTPAVCIKKFTDIVDYLTERLQPGDFVLVAGSQSINQVAFMLVDRLNELYEITS